MHFSLSSHLKNYNQGYENLEEKKPLTFFTTKPPQKCIQLINQPSYTQVSRVTIRIPVLENEFLEQDFLVTQMVKHLPIMMRETRIQSLGREDPLEKDLENPMDGGAHSMAIFHGVAKSRTWLSNFTFFLEQGNWVYLELCLGYLKCHSKCFRWKRKGWCRCHISGYQWLSDKGPGTWSVVTFEGRESGQTWDGTHGFWFDCRFQLLVLRIQPSNALLGYAWLCVVFFICVLFNNTLFKVENKNTNLHKN